MDNNNVVLVFPSALSPAGALVRAIKKIGGNSRLQTAFEGSRCIVCEGADPVELSSRLASLFGAEWVVVARKVPGQFSSISSAIADIGSKLVQPCEKFFVKVEAEERRDFAGRDVEFAASGTLTAKLAGIGASPAKNEEEANRIILTIVGKESAYICVQARRAPGGLPAGSLGKALCAVYSPLSFLSSFMAARAGFELDVALLYKDESELYNNAKLAEALARKTGIAEHTLTVARISLPDVPRGVAELAKEQVALSFLASLRGGRVVLPLAAGIHPVWLVESAMRQAARSGKIPYTPLLFAPDLCRQAEEIELDIADLQNNSEISENRLEKYRPAIGAAAKSSAGRAKAVRLKVGPNYLHDLLDSV